MPYMGHVDKIKKTGPLRKQQKCVASKPNMIIFTEISLSLSSLSNSIHNTESMATDPPSSASEIVTAEYKLPRSIYDLTADFFDSCRLLNPSVRLGPLVSLIPAFDPEDKSSKDGVILDRWTCNTCKIEFVSLQDQRSHFKSDIHRLNVISLFFLLVDINPIGNHSNLIWLLCCDRRSS